MMFLAEVVLEGARVSAVIGKLEAARMPEHVRVDRELELSADANTRQKLAEARRGHRCPALGHEDVTAAAFFAFECPQRPHLLCP